MKNMPKTKLSAERYNKRMDKIFQKCIDAKKKEVTKHKLVYEKAFNDIHKLHENKIVPADSREAKVLVLLSQLMEQTYVYRA